MSSTAAHNTHTHTTHTKHYNHPTYLPLIPSSLLLLSSSSLFSLPLPLPPPPRHLLLLTPLARCILHTLPCTTPPPRQTSLALVCSGQVKGTRTQRLGAHNIALSHQTFQAAPPSLSTFLLLFLPLISPTPTSASTIASPHPRIKTGRRESRFGPNSRSAHPRSSSHLAVPNTSRIINRNLPSSPTPPP